MTQFWQIFLRIFLQILCISLAIGQQKIDVKLTRIDLLSLLGLRDPKSGEGAEKDGRLDGILGFGTSVYTAKLGIGNPPQHLDFVLNLAGDLPFPQVGALSFMVNLDCEGAVPCYCKDPFNHSASNSFLPRHDVDFHTKFGSGNGVSLGIRIGGFFGGDRIEFTDQYSPSPSISIFDEWLGQAQTISGSLFNRLPFDGILSLGRQSPLIKMLEKESQSMQMIFGADGGNLVLRPDLNRDGPLCARLYESQWVNLLKDEVVDPEMERPNLGAFKFMMEGGVRLKTNPVDYFDANRRKVFINPNSPFLQAPAAEVRKMAKVVNAEKVILGQWGHQFWIVPSTIMYGPLTLGINGQVEFQLEKDSLNIGLTSTLLPSGFYLWAIQELPEEEADFWVFGRPFFDKFCVNFRFADQKIGFPLKR